jgi:hypothetical protein
MIQHMYSLKREPREKDKLAPQPQKIVAIIGKKTIERSKLVAELERRLGKTSVQKGTTIVSFWKLPLEKMGLLKITKVETDEKKKIVAKAKPRKKVVAKVKAKAKAKPRKKVVAAAPSEEPVTV